MTKTTEQAIIKNLEIEILNMSPENKKSWVEQIIQDGRYPTNSPTREQKILLLENELYSKVQAGEVGESVDNLMATIEILQANKCQDEQTDIKLNSGFSPTINAYLWTALQIGVVAILSSYLGTKLCGDSQSKMCKNFRIIPELVRSYISEPKSKVLPINPN